MSMPWIVLHKSACKTILILLIGIFFTRTYAAEEPQYNIILTSKVEDNQPTQQASDIFDCTDRIYLVVEALGLTLEKHDLTVSWLNPLGKQQEKTDYKFDAQPFTRVWAWLQLSGPPGAVIGQVFDPSFGMEDFIGEWRAKVAIDRKSVETLKFNVLC